jgi:hypothetical protein
VLGLVLVLVLELFVLSLRLVVADVGE